MAESSLVSTNKVVRIVELLSRSPQLVDALRKDRNPIRAPDPYIIFGPYGGRGGFLFDDGAHTGIRKIEIAASDCIDSICVEYDDGGHSALLGKHGVSEGGNKSVIQLDYPGEFLISMSGYKDIYCDDTIVRQLTFKSNTRIYGPFGTRSGEFFSLPQTSGKIIGFHGRSGRFMDSIGAHVVPTTGQQPYIICGPYGGQGGSLWNDGTHTTIRKIEIAVAEYIDSIRVEYDDGGHSALLSKHGESTEGIKSTIKLDYPGEFLISMHGYIDKYNDGSDLSVVRQLTFKSNRRIYGPFGTQKGELFSLPQTDGKIIGFHGRSGWLINSIGVYLSPVA